MYTKNRVAARRAVSSPAISPADCLQHTLAAVDQLAAREDVTRSEAIRRLIEFALMAKSKRQNADDN